MQAVLLLLLSSPYATCEKLEHIADWRSAYKCYARIAKRNQKTRPSVAIIAKYREGMCLWHRGHRSRALKRFRRVVRESPDASDDEAARAHLMLLESRFESARSKRDAERLLPAYDGVAKLGNWEVTIEAYRRIEKLLRMMGRHREADEVRAKRRWLDTENEVDH